MKEFHPEQLKKLTGTLPKVDLNVDNFELWMTVMSAVESADQIWRWIIVGIVHMHHSQPLKIKFGTNHFLGSETLVPIQYREGVKYGKKLLMYDWLCASKDWRTLFEAIAT